ncbi:MAG: response regulator [Alphaproteobacteria bacterium]|jgi:CheY-like chemotaxis protein|nr:response regulator [Alphaproteobacteria bacterium]MBU2042645.1 response regulator [Alphaproteobacteria bacterium]MBU2124697.1 response regulator [Alphaproteobacteria bacterium]MBU2207516.1 response regulator [Alphaproteobacteria bacterium]MBU2291151.1 response regulator [Alphaproteobacteria bacterium]
MNGPGEALRDSAVINLTGAVTMIVDDSPFALDLTTQALMGFGIRARHACRSAAEAMEILKDQNIDLLVVDCEMPGIDGFELVRWLRRSGLEPNAFVPVIMTAAHIRKARVAEARDCGANFVITKPFSATTLLERIVWVARDGRPFLEIGDYFGPDRRFRKAPAPGEERRADLIRKQAFEDSKRQTAADGDAA